MQGLILGKDTVMKKWSEKRANEWYDAQPWLVGCNFLASFGAFLNICESLGMRCIIVFFDDCHWDHDIRLGPQQPRIT